MELLAEAGDPFIRRPGGRRRPGDREPVTHSRREIRPAEHRRRHHPDLPPSAVAPAALTASSRPPRWCPTRSLWSTTIREGSVDPAHAPSRRPASSTPALGINATGGRNAGWRASRSDICIFIDDDNEVDDRCVEVLAQACATGCRPGRPGHLLGRPRDHLVRRPRGVQVDGHHPLPVDRRAGAAGVAGDHGRPTACPDMYALRREVLERVGGLDDRAFPMCGEEYDLAERVGALGLDRIIVREARGASLRQRLRGPGRATRPQHLGPRSANGHCLMARSRVRVRRRHARGLPRYTTLLIFLPSLDGRIGGLLPPGQGSAGRPGWRPSRPSHQGLREGYREAALRMTVATRNAK